MSVQHTLILNQKHWIGRYWWKTDKFKWKCSFETVEFPIMQFYCYLYRMEFESSFKVCSCSSNPDYMAPAATWQIEMVLSRDPCPAPTAHQCCLRLQCQHSGLCVAQWAQLFPLTPRAHVTKAHREWERDRHPDICLCRLRDMQTYKHCRDTGSFQKSKPTHRDACVQLVVHYFNTYL